MRRRAVLGAIAIAFGCLSWSRVAGETTAARPYVVVLGVAQDGGRPQAGCTRTCCAAAWEKPELRRNVASLAIVDPSSGERWIVDATPDFARQLRALDAVAPPRSPAKPPALDGILLTHAHAGHYLGLAQLGREVLGASKVPVLAMPRMCAYLGANGPWSQLVQIDNIVLVELADGARRPLNARLAIVPFRVPHRDEYSETVGFRIEGPTQSVVWLPDVDKWEKWETPIETLVQGADVAYLDGTFYANGEIPNRDMSEIPHPFIVESMRRLAPLAPSERAKVRFVHLNHTNPALDPGSDAAKAIEAAGFRIAREGERVEL